MKKRYFYVVASFMRKDKENSLGKIDFTIMLDDGSALFPLMKAVEAISKNYSNIADLTTIQFDTYFEIGKKDYEAYNQFKGFVSINNK